MKKRIKGIIGMVLALMMVFSMCACGKSGGDSKTLNIYIWSEYIPEEVIQDFTAKTGVKVNVTYYASMDEMMAKLQTGAFKDYDLIQPYCSEIPALIEQGFIQEINYDNIPNMKYIDKDYLNQEFDPEQKYTVPYVTGGDYICYNNKNCKVDIKSFADLADPALKGQIVSIASAREIMGMALDSLGYDPNTKNENEIKEATDLLNKIKPNIKVFDGDAPRKELMNGECSVAITYSQDFAIAKQDAPDDYDIADIDSGYCEVVSEFCVTKGAANSKNAELFINYIQDPKVMASILDEYPNGCVNTEATKYTGDAYNTCSGVDYTDEQKAKLWRLVDVGETTTLYDQYWSKFMNE